MSESEAASIQEGVDNNDPYEEMVTYITGKRKHERLSKERAIRFPTKVSNRTSNLLLTTRSTLACVTTLSHLYLFS